MREFVTAETDLPSLTAGKLMEYSHQKGLERVGSVAVRKRERGRESRGEGGEGESCGGYGGRVVWKGDGEGAGERVGVMVVVVELVLNVVRKRGREGKKKQE